MFYVWKFVDAIYAKVSIDTIGLIMQQLHCFVSFKV